MSVLLLVILLLLIAINGFFVAAEFARGDDRARTRSLLKAVIAGS